MRAVAPAKAREEALPRLVDLPEPEPGADEVLIEVRAAGINRADLLQLRGLYPSPPGESRIPGLEASGFILRVGEKVTDWRAGDRVMTLVAGGAQAERLVAPAAQLMPLPVDWSFEEGAALPEAAITAWTNLVVEGELERGEWVLISGATGGVGSFAVPLAAALGARVVASGRDAARLETLKSRGASIVVGEGPDLADRLIALGVEGVDLVLEMVGGASTASHLETLRSRGRFMLVGVLGGSRAEIDLGRILRLRLRVEGSTLRSRSRREKAELISAFRLFAEPRFESGELRPVVGKVFPFEKVAEAYQSVASGGVTGKTVLDLTRR